MRGAWIEIILNVTSPSVEKVAPHAGNAVKLSKILIAHASNSVCFFHVLSLLVNNKIKKLVK